MTPLKLCSLAIILVFFAATCIVPTTDAMCDKHYPHRGCQCQCGGELNGHCHCPYGGHIPGVYCRDGGNHMICFPWGGGGCPFPRCNE